MKRQWTAEELAEQWTLAPGERELLANKTGATRLGFALLLKLFQQEGRFPEHRPELPGAVVEHVARQVGVPAQQAEDYPWSGRTAEYHRAQVRQALGFRAATAADVDALIEWLGADVVRTDHHLERLRAAVLERCRLHHVEPPSGDRMDRLIRSALHTDEERLAHTILECLTPTTRAQLDALLATDERGVPPGPDQGVTIGSAGERSNVTADDSAAAGLHSSVLQDLKADPGGLELESVFAELHKLQTLRQVGLPPQLFHAVAPKIVQSLRQRAAAETPSLLRAHPPAIRATLLAALCWRRSQEVTDGLVEIVLQLVQKIGAHAEQKVAKELVAAVKRVTGKDTLLVQIAVAAVANPQGTVAEVVFPAAGGEQRLHDVIAEFRAGTPTYRRRVQTKLRASYSSYYRLLPATGPATLGRPGVPLQQHDTPTGHRGVGDPPAGADPALRRTEAVDV